MAHKQAFVASTYEDLADHREHIIRALRDGGIHVDPMENWTAAADAPRRFSPERLVGCDLCVLLVARRRGHVPEGETSSITQLEYRAAIKQGIDVLVFLLSDDAPWHRQYDELDTDPELRAWRNELSEEHGVSEFTHEPESVEIHSAISRWALDQVFATPQPLQLANNLTDLEEPIALAGSDVPEIERTLSSIIALDRHKVLVVDLAGGKAWWSTRLFLLASLVRDFTGVNLVALHNDTTGYLGIVDPPSLAHVLAATRPDLAERYQKMDGFSAEDGMATSARQFVDSFEAGEEKNLQTWVTAEALRDALADSLNTACLLVRDRDETATQLFLHQVIRQQASHVAVLLRDDGLLGVIDRDRLAVLFQPREL